MEDKLNPVQLDELRRKLSTMSVTALKDAYQSAYFQCKLDGDKIRSARAIQTLVQAWREMRGWSSVDSVRPQSARRVAGSLVGGSVPRTERRMSCRTHFTERSIKSKLHRR